MLSTLRLAPFLYLFCGYWMLTNQQLLSNDHLHPIYSEEQEPETDHNLSLILSAEGWQGPYWAIGIMAVFALSYYLIADRLNKFLARRGFKAASIGDSLSQMDEGLQNFWQALKRRNIEWTLKEEYYRKNALGMQMMTDE